jgi:hypothetical protein
LNAKEAVCVNSSNGVNAVAIPSWMQVEDDGWDTETIEEAPGYEFYNKSVKLFFDAGPHIYYRFDEEGNRINVDGVTTILDVINKPFLKAWAAKLAVEFVKEQMLLPDGSFKAFSTEEFMAMLHEAKGQHKVHLDKAGDIGHIAHDILEKSIKFAIKHTNGIILELKELPTEDTPANGMAINCAKHALKWAQDHNVRWLETERKVYSKEFDVAGTMDGLCIVDSCEDLECCRGRVFKNRKAVADFKSSNQLADSYAYQVAIYLFAYIEELLAELGVNLEDIFIPDRWVLRLGKTEGDFEPWYLPSDYFAADVEAFLSALDLYRSLKEITERRQEDGRELRAIINERKRVAREAKESQEREERRLAKIERMRLTKERNDAKDSHYKALRSSGMSPIDAKHETALKFPKPEKAEVEPKLEPIVNKDEEPFEIEWVLNL